MNTITAQRGFPVKAVAIALALAVVLSILAIQAIAVVTTPTSNPVVVQQESSDLGSGFIAGPKCPEFKLPRGPHPCLSGGAGRGQTLAHKP
jgi:hypothetical protein